MLYYGQMQESVLTRTMKPTNRYKDIQKRLVFIVKNSYSQHLFLSETLTSLTIMLSPKMWLIIVLLGACISYSLPIHADNSAVAHKAMNCPDYPYFKPSNGPLALVNCDFHHTYDKRVNEILKTFGTVAGHPVLLNLGGNLIFKHNGQIETMNAAPDRFHLIKAFSHAMFTTNLILQYVHEGPLPPATKEELTTLQSHLTQSVAEMDDLDLQQEEKTLMKKLATHNLDFIKQLLKSNYFTQEKIKRFFFDNRATLENAIKLDAKIQLSLLDQAANQWLDSLNNKERQKLGIVVATAHQARANEISLQYFAKKLGFQYGEGAQHENGFVVLEGKFDEESALKLLARHYLDQEASFIMFNNPERLQNDVLGPAAHEILAANVK